MPAIDRAAALRLLGGDEKLLKEIQDLFLEDSPKQVAALSRALETGQADQARLTSHALKSASGSVGALVVRDLSLAIETAAKAGDLARARQLEPQLRLALTEAHASLKR